MQPATLRTPLSLSIFLLIMVCMCGSAAVSATLPTSEAAESKWQTVEAPSVDVNREVGLPLRSALAPGTPASSRLSIGLPAYGIPTASSAQSLPHRGHPQHYDLLRPLSVSARGPPAGCDYVVDAVFCVAPKSGGARNVTELGDGISWEAIYKQNYADTFKTSSAGNTLVRKTNSAGGTSWMRIGTVGSKPQPYLTRVHPDAAIKKGLGTKPPGTHYGHTYGNENWRQLAAGRDLGISREMAGDFARQPGHWQIEPAKINMSRVGEMDPSLG